MFYYKPININVDDKFLNFSAAAKYLCVSSSKLYKMTHRNEIRYYKVGRLNVFSLQDLQEYVKSKVVLTVSELNKQADNNLITANSFN